MSEKPILFSGEMVRAILEGRKTQTRRTVKPKFLYDPTDDGWDILWATGQLTCPYGEVGDRLWVRETWHYDSHMHELTGGEPDAPDGRYLHRLVYRADNPDWQAYGGWRPSIFMPRWACRLELVVKSVRVERLQDIGHSDMKAEGCLPPNNAGGSWDYLRETYWKPLWDSINAKRGYGWDSNPWVWVVEFDKVQP